MRMRETGQTGLLGKLITAIVGAILLVLGFMFSVVLIAIVVAVGLGVWAWFWWKTRKIRQQMRENPPPAWEKHTAPDGHVIEGEAVIVEEEVTRATVSRLPESPDRRSPD
jgi:uncharacterized protein YneF (UPF0154 family)